MSLAFPGIRSGVLQRVLPSGSVRTPKVCSKCCGRGLRITIWGCGLKVTGYIIVIIFFFIIVMIDVAGNPIRNVGIRLCIAVAELVHTAEEQAA